MTAVRLPARRGYVLCKIKATERKYPEKQDSTGRKKSSCKITQDFCICSKPFLFVTKKLLLYDCLSPKFSLSTGPSMNSIKMIYVDDEDLNLKLVEKFCQASGLEPLLFNSPKAALEHAAKTRIDIALVDYCMPEMDGVELTRQLKLMYPDIFIIMITSLSENEQIKISAIQNGAVEFLGKPLNLVEFSARLINIKELVTSRLLIKNKAALLKNEIDKATESIALREYETLMVLGRAAEYKDSDTGNHTNRVAYYSKLILSSVTQDETELDLIFYSAPLHDIGKIGISDNILLKPGKLTPEEFEIIKKHTIIGADILKGSISKYLKKGMEIALTHHEKYDGTGYPHALKGENIPLFGRIVALSDVFDALTSKRPYKDPWTIDAALEFIDQNKGKHFDPELAKIFVGSKKQITKIKQSNLETEPGEECLNPPFYQK